jgi:hypothetical protein
MGEEWMYRKVFIVALSLLLIAGMAGCARKNVRHLASDVSLVSPGTTKKQEVLNYLGQPDAEYKMDGGDILWVYYEEKTTLLGNTPYLGEKFGKKTYEIVKVVFAGDNVRSIGYRTMREEDFNESGLDE